MAWQLPQCAKQNRVERTDRRLNVAPILLEKDSLAAQTSQGPLHLARYSDSREVPLSVLKCETVLGTLDPPSAFLGLQAALLGLHRAHSRAH